MRGLLWAATGAAALAAVAAVAAMVEHSTRLEAYLPWEIQASGLRWRDLCPSVRDEATRVAHQWWGSPTQRHSLVAARALAREGYFEALLRGDQGGAGAAYHAAYCRVRRTAGTAAAPKAAVA